MKSNIKIITAFAFCLGSLSLTAQQAPMFTHYMYNTLSINPAYAGSREALSITALHRSQWLDFKGAPMTQTLTMHSPIASKNIGLGLSLANDRIGPVNNSSAYLSFAYKIKLNSKSKLALGLNGGLNLLQANLTSLELEQQNDPSFATNIRNKAMSNFGFGAYYSRERFYAGVSTPNLVQNKYPIVTLADGTQSTGIERRHYFFIAGAVFNLSKNVAFKPTTLVKVTEAAPIQMDVTASFILNQKLLIGAMFRSGDAFGALVGVDLSQQLHVGYSFDWSYGIRTFKYNTGSHEIMLRYDFNFSSKKQIQSPRYF
jgi:type IX secretion system PorP/SprF family membrane protein